MKQIKVGDKMRIRNIKNKEEILSNSSYYVKNPEKNKGKWSKVFDNKNEIHLEIGMGKGDFIIEMAKTYPNINFIGIEKYESVLVRAVQKLEKEKLKNIKLISYDAINLNDIIDKEITNIYLNFSDPWPKKRHFKRRLTYVDYLKVYDKLFVKDANIILKSDNDIFFESSLISLNNYGYIFDEIYLDLWETDVFSPKTEYEIKFSSKGYKIKYLKAHKFMV